MQNQFKNNRRNKLLLHSFLCYAHANWPIALSECGAMDHNVIYRTSQERLTMKNKLILFSGFLVVMTLLIWYGAGYRRIKNLITKKLTNFSPKSEKAMYILEKLPYSYDALEPYIDARTMEIHYSKHHQGYANNLNKSLEKHNELSNRTIEDLLSNLATVPEAIRTQVQNFGGGVYNHTLFWNCMKKNGGGQPTGHLQKAINQTFGSFDKFQTEFSDAAKKVFGSGWAWLSVDKNKKLILTTSANQDCPLSEGNSPIMCIDVWEHAYYLKYQQNRGEFVDNWWHIVDWNSIEKRYDSAIKR